MTLCFRPASFGYEGTLDVMPAYGETPHRLEFWGDTLDRITEVDALTGSCWLNITSLASILPSTYHTGGAPH